MNTSKFTYTDERKKNSYWKRVFNEFLHQWVSKYWNVRKFLGEYEYTHPRQLRATVIDGKYLLSSQALTSAGVKPSNVRVINWNPDIIQHARQNGHILSMVGTSTQILQSMTDQQHIVYLDNCGTVHKCTHFNPSSLYPPVDPPYDVARACQLLSSNGLLIATHSTRGKSTVETAIDMVPEGMYLVKELMYKDGKNSACMHSMIWTKNLQQRQELKDLFNFVKKQEYEKMAIEALCTQRLRKKQRHTVREKRKSSRLVRKSADGENIKKRLRSTHTRTSSPVATDDNKKVSKTSKKRLRTRRLPLFVDELPHLKPGVRVAVEWNMTDNTTRFYNGIIRKKLGGNKCIIKYVGEPRLQRHCFKADEEGITWKVLDNE